MNPEGPSLETPVIRICILALIAFLLCSILAIRIWDMQIRRGDFYDTLSEKQSNRTIRVPALRGEILDRDGNVLAGNRVSYDVLFHPSEMLLERSKDLSQFILDNAERAGAEIGRANPLTKTEIRRHLNMRPGLAITVFKDLSPEELGRLTEMHPPIRGLEISAQPVRDYPYGSFAAHMLGYVARDDRRMAPDRASYYYYLSDLSGRSGLERLLDDKLRGRPGRQTVVVNSNGFITESQDKEEWIEPENGFDVQLTLDLNVQSLAEEALKRRNGAIVVLDARTGAILAMASSPAYDPAAFVPSISVADYRALQNDPNHPFLNRATSSYMPGSIIKPLVALAALEAGVDPEETIDCKGLSPHGYGRGIHCTSRRGHGPLNMYDALKRSCNVYFVERGMELGVARLSALFQSAGIGSKTGVELSENSGYLPKDGPRWNRNETAYISIGQGKVLVTPLQAASWFAAIANGGTLWKPYLVERVYDPVPKTGRRLSVYDAKPEKRGTLAASPENIAKIREGLFRVVNDPKGTGRRAQNDGAIICGKTGTADVSTPSGPRKNTWFCGYAEHPETKALYSFAILIENGSSGGGTCAPIAAKIFGQWFGPVLRRSAPNAAAAPVADASEPED